VYKFDDEKRSQVNNLRDRLVAGCEECGGTGYLPVSSVPGALRRCECMVVLRYLMELVVANIPADYWGLSIAELEIDQAYKDTVSFYLQHLATAVEKGRGLTFLGPNGVGKTSLMCEIGKAALVAGYSVRYFPLSLYITALQKERVAEIEDMESGRILLIDELDKKYRKAGSDYVVKMLDESLRRFLGAGKVLILCTNWSEAEIRENFGESTVSLLRRRCEFLEMVGDDYSRKLQAEYWDDLKVGIDYYCAQITEPAWLMEEVRDGR